MKGKNSVSGFLFSFLALAAIASTPSYSAAQGAFTLTQGSVSRKAYSLFGGTVEDIAVATDGEVYVALNSASGLFCSTNAGISWSGPGAGANLGRVHAVEVGASPSTVFFIARNSLFRSQDACQTWIELAGSENRVDYRSALVFGHNVLLAEKVDGSLDRSTDNGNTFRNVKIDSEVTRILDFGISPSVGVVFAVAQKGNDSFLYRSGDDGATWSATGKIGNFTEVEVDPTLASRIILASTDAVEISSDGGVTFTPLAAPARDIASVTFIGTRWYVGDSYSDDGGVTWTSLNSVSIRESKILGALSIKPNEYSVIFAASKRGVAKSTDAGQTWHDMTTGMYGVTVYDIVQSSDKQTVLAASDKGLALSTNFGSSTGPTWTFPVPLGEQLSAVNAVHIDRSDERILLAALSSGSIYRSTDRGATWRLEYTDFNAGTNINDFFQLKDGTIFAGFSNPARQGRGGILRSIDNGNNWTLISAGSVDGDVRALAEDNGFLLAGLGSATDSAAVRRGVYRFSGGKWSKVAGPFANLVVNDVVVDRQTWLVATGDGSTAAVFRSTDGGQSFSDVTANGLRFRDGKYRAISIDPDQRGKVFLTYSRPSGESFIFKSRNGGETWTPLYNALKSEIPQAFIAGSLLAGFDTGFFSFSESTFNLSASLKKRSLLCSLTSSGLGMPGRLVFAKVKNSGEKAFRFYAKTRTNENGLASFKISALPKGTNIRCKFETSRSGVRIVR